MRKWVTAGKQSYTTSVRRGLNSVRSARRARKPTKKPSDLTGRRASFWKKSGRRDTVRTYYRWRPGLGSRDSASVGHWLTGYSLRTRVKNAPRSGLISIPASLSVETRLRRRPLVTLLRWNGSSDPETKVSTCRKNRAIDSSCPSITRRCRSKDLSRRASLELREPPAKHATRLVQNTNSGKPALPINRFCRRIAVPCARISSTLRTPTSRIERSNSARMISVARFIPA